MAFDLIARLRLDDQLSSRLGRITRGFGDIERRTRSATDGLKRFSSSVASIGSAIGITAAVAGGFNMIRNSIGSAMDRIDTMEQFNSVMTVMTGSTEIANRALEETRDIVTGTAFGLDVAASSVQKFVTSGMKVGDATRIFGSFTDAVAFYTRGTDQELSTVSDALAKMTTRGKVQMDQLGRIIEAGIPAIDIYAEAMGISTQEVTDAMSKGQLDTKRFLEVMDEALANGTKSFPALAGAAKEAGASWAGTFGNMRSAITRGVQNIITKTDEALVKSGLPDMRQMIANIGKTFENMLGRVADFMPTVIDHIKRFSQYWPLIKEGLIGAAVAFGVFRAAIMGASIVSAVAAMANPFNLVILAIGALIAIGVMLWRNWDTIKEKAGELWASIKERWEMLKTATSDAWEDVKTRISNAMESARNAVSDFFRPLFDFIDRAKARWDDFKSAISNFKLPKIGLPRFLGGGGLIQTAASSHYHGIDRVPYDRYPALLHRGERVLTRQEADLMDRYSFEGLTGGSTIYNQQTYNNITNTQTTGDAAGGTSQPISLTVQYYGQDKLSESEMHRFAGFLVNQLTAAKEAGA